MPSSTGMPAPQEGEIELPMSMHSNVTSCASNYLYRWSILLTQAIIWLGA